MQSRTLKELNTTESGKVVQVKLYYNVGGSNYFTGETEQRGFYISVTPVTINKCNGYTTVTTGAFTGYKKLVKNVKRFSRKTLNELNIEVGIIDELVNAVLTKNGLHLK